MEAGAGAEGVVSPAEEASQAGGALSEGEELREVGDGRMSDRVSEGEGMK